MGWAQVPPDTPRLGGGAAAPPGKHPPCSQIRPWFCCSGLVLWEGSRQGWGPVLCHQTALDSVASIAKPRASRVTVTLAGSLTSVGSVTPQDWSF